MQVKLVKGNEEKLFECANIAVKKITEGMAVTKDPMNMQPGIYIEMSEVNHVRGAMLQIVLPDDGDTVYVTNVEGHTTETYRWPPAKKEASK